MCPRACLAPPAQVVGSCCVVTHSSWARWCGARRRRRRGWESACWNDWWRGSRWAEGLVLVSAHRPLLFDSRPLSPAAVTGCVTSQPARPLPLPRPRLHPTPAQGRQLQQQPGSYSLEYQMLVRNYRSHSRLLELPSRCGQWGRVPGSRCERRSGQGGNIAGCSFPSAAVPPVWLPPHGLLL